MNNQEAFNIAVSGILKQGAKSMDRSKCLYRGPNNLKCAVDHLIPDELYNPKMEMGIQQLVIEYSQIRALFNNLSVNLLLDLQKAHDNAFAHDSESFVEDFEYQARRIAKAYNLSEDVLNNESQPQ